MNLSPKGGADMTEENIVKFWLEQSKLMWGRVQTISAVEAGALSAWYVLYDDKHPLLATGILVLDTLMLGFLALLMRRDAAYMSACEEQCPNLFPAPSAKPIFNLRGRDIAFGIPMTLLIFNVWPLVATWLP
jgi:hypothetical protein